MDAASAPPITILDAEGAEVAQYVPPARAGEVLAAEFGSAGALRGPGGLKVCGDSVLVPGATYAHAPPKRTLSSLSAPTCPSVVEGINESAPYTARQETCEELLQRVMGSCVCLVRSPPRSGKTALLRLLAASIRDLYPHALVYRLQLSELAALPYCEESNALSRFIEERTAGHASPQALQEHSEAVRFLLLDEAQRAYRYAADGFWVTLKSLTERSSRSAHVVLFAAHGIDVRLGEFATPFEPEVQLASEFLMYRQSEYDELIDKYNAFARGKSAEITEQVRQVMAEFSGLHPGVIALLLTRIYEFHKCHDPHWVQPSDSSLSELITGADTTSWLYQNERLFPKSSLSAEQRMCLVDVLMGKVATVPLERRDDYNYLLREGLLSLTEDKFLVFTSPCIEWIYTRLMLFMPHPPGTPVASDLREATRLAIAAMNPVTLCGAVREITASRPSASKRSMSNVLERVYTMEFYRAFSRQLDSDSCIVPERPVYNSEGKLVGFLDFFVNRHRAWGVEVLIQGAGMSLICLKRY
eukprot:m51a1_g3616 hypothetical protein (529) ;mRNA; f:68840-70892